MIKIARIASVVVLTAAVTVLVMLYATKTEAAQAGSGTVVCTGQASNHAAAAQQWMQQQLQSGRLKFVTIERGLCAY
jgi:uncharacterized membrane protein YoaK (UPF0700 family)